MDPTQLLALPVPEHSPYQAGSCSHIFGSPAGAGSHQQPGGPKSFSKGLGLPGRMGADTPSGEPWNEHLEQREMRGWYPCQHQQWMEKSSNLLVWRKGPLR